MAIPSSRLSCNTNTNTQRQKVVEQKQKIEEKVQELKKKLLPVIHMKLLRHR